MKAVLGGYFPIVNLHKAILLLWERTENREEGEEESRGKEMDVKVMFVRRQVVTGHPHLTAI